MGYICPYCGEGLPEDTPCPCTIGSDDDVTEVQPLRRRALTPEIDDTTSPVRQFLDERFTSGLKDLQRRFRQGGPPLGLGSGGSERKVSRSLNNQYCRQEEQKNHNPGFHGGHPGVFAFYISPIVVFAAYLKRYRPIMGTIHAQNGSYTS